MWIMKTATAIATKSSGKNFFFQKIHYQVFCCCCCLFSDMTSCCCCCCTSCYYLSFLCLSIRFVIPIFFWCSIRSFYANVQIYLMFFFVCVFLTPFLLCVCVCVLQIEKFTIVKNGFIGFLSFSLYVCVCATTQKNKNG